MQQPEEDRWQKRPVTEILRDLAKTDRQNFLTFFRRFRKLRKEDAIHACVEYLGTNELDSAGKQMAAWLSLDDGYLPLLLDCNLFSVETAKHAASSLQRQDPYFWSKLSRITSQDANPPTSTLARALALSDEGTNLAVLIPWLRNLTSHHDQQIRSKAVKTLSRITANQGFVDRQLQSNDARVRSNAIEGLWGVNNAETRSIFQKGLSDSHHRVVVNALIGLYLQRDESALPRMRELAAHPAPMWRRAISWAFEYIQDQRSIPALRMLAQDADPITRERAARVLAKMAILEIVKAEKEPAALESEDRSTPAVQPTAEPVDQKGDSFSVPRFAQLG